MIRIGKRFFSTVTFTLILFAAMPFFVSGCGKDGNNTKNTENSPSNVVLYLNDVPVSSEEYEMLVKEYCNQIYMQYSTEQINSEEFWETEIDGTAPYTLLEDVILAELKGNYALKSLAVELEVTQDYTYGDLLSSMERENESGSGSSKRETESSQDVSEAESSYGLTGYDESSYYKYWYSNLESQVIGALIQSKVNISQTECESYYEENADEFTYETGVSVWYAEIPYGDNIRQKEAQEKARALSTEMEKAKEAGDIPEEFGDVEIQELDLNSLDTQTGMSGIYAQRWELASHLSEGQVCGPYEQDGAYCVIKCISRTENGIVDFETVSSQIERYLQVQEAQKLITQKADQMEVKEGNITPKEIILSALKQR